MNEDFLQALREICGPQSVLDARALSGRDCGFHPDNLGAEYAVRPCTTDQVADIVTLCNRHNVAIVPHGGLTGLAGGAVSHVGQLILSTSRLQNTLVVDPLNRVAHVSAGVTLEALDQAASAHGLCAGIDIGARGTATIGGMIATNAGGSEAFRNGIMRDRVLGLEAVTAAGIVVSDLRQVAKANEGIDVKHVFIGSEGTLGIITCAVLRLEPAPKECCTLIASFPNVATALGTYDAINNMPAGTLMRAEIMWRDYAVATAQALDLSAILPNADQPVHVIFEVEPSDMSVDAFLEPLAEILEVVACEDVLVAQSERERANIWLVREESWALERDFPYGFWYDVSLPLGELEAYVDRVSSELHTLDPTIRVFVMGHLGDGNLHLTIARKTEMPDLHRKVSEIVYRGLTDTGSSFSAEHGIGSEKLKDLERLGDPGKLAAARLIKDALDPNGILNPGKVIPRSKRKGY